MNSKIALITGEKGFVGPYLREELENNNYTVYGLGLTGENSNTYFVCDILDKEKLCSIIKKVKPDVVFHLAGFSSVRESFKNPELCNKINVDGTRNLLESIQKANLKPKILIVSSADVYGNSDNLPLKESHPLNPTSPYAKSRVKQEALAKEFKLPIIIARSFNHTGPTQPTQFVIPSFREQVKNAKDGETIHVGNLSVSRDFSDVKDVVKAYRLLVEKGGCEIYNVGSGYEYKLEQILNKFIADSGKNIKIEIDSEKYRKADIQRMVCDPAKIEKLTGFKFKKMF